MSEFKSFDSVLHIGKLWMRITQKIHGSNAQIYIYPDEITGEKMIKAGSRNRWLTPEDDNYGFAKFVYENKDAFLNLGFGRHYGEWAGPGINSGEGLSEKTLFLFSEPDRYHKHELPIHTTFVPEIYKGPADLSKIDECMSRLLERGSYVVAGFDKPEGVVIEIAEKKYKRVFEQEDSKWCAKKERPPRVRQDFSALLQPIRLQKLLSREERYVRDYPDSLPDLAKDYFLDLVKEEQVIGDEKEIILIRKKASRDIFHFIKTYIMGNLNAKVAE